MALGRILIVDDITEVRKMLSLVLAQANYDVVEAEDGEQAIAAINSGDNPQTVSLIICDLNMPKVNGMEAIAYFRSQFPSIPIIVMSGQSKISNVASLFKQGVANYLVKPVSSTSLMTAVADAIKACH